MKIILIVIAVIAAVFLVIEGGLRLFLGLGKRPLYLADPEIGYLLAPNQTLRRFGKRIEINQYSMRSAPISPQRPLNTLRVLLLGDSIANGAGWTDQAKTISALIEKQLTNHPQGQKIEVLNASANSWGPRNQLAYLRRFGTFEAQVVILLMNTDDLFATAPTSLPVGRDPLYSSEQPDSAISDLYSRFFVHPKPIPGMGEVMAEPGDRVGINLKALEEIQRITNQSQAQFLIAITPLVREIDGSKRREYEEKARIRLASFVETHNIFLIDFLPLFENTEFPQQLFRDNIHLSPQGNQEVSDIISQFILTKIFN